MNTLIIFSSQFGNTEKIAKAIAEGAGGQAVRAKDAASIDWASCNTLIVGSPTQGGRATVDLIDFVNRIPDRALQNKKVAAFDTRFAPKNHGFGLRLLMKTIGYAAPKLASKLQQKGGNLAAQPEGFIVTDKEGPLAKGEVERAKAWGKTITSHK